MSKQTNTVPTHRDLDSITPKISFKKKGLRKKIQNLRDDLQEAEEELKNFENASEAFHCLRGTGGRTRSLFTAFCKDTSTPNFSRALIRRPNIGNHHYDSKVMVQVDDLNGLITRSTKNGQTDIFCILVTKWVIPMGHAGGTPQRVPDSIHEIILSKDSSSHTWKLSGLKQLRIVGDFCRNYQSISLKVLGVQVLSGGLTIQSLIEKRSVTY